MKIGQRVVVVGLDPYRGMTGTLIAKMGVRLRFVVQLDDGREIRTSSVKRA
jgi:hypothetical protein